jgi:hypothetical protein
MGESIESTRVAINTLRARLTILGFNLVITTFQISNTRGLGGGIQFDGFQTTVHLAAGTVLVVGVALSIAAVVVFIASSTLDETGTCDHWAILAGDLLMYLALALTITGFFSPYTRVLAGVSMPTQGGQEALMVIRTGIAVTGSTAWVLATYIGPMISLLRASHNPFTKLVHVGAYVGILIGVSRLWWAASKIESHELADGGFVPAWFNAFLAPLYW